MFSLDESKILQQLPSGRVFVLDVVCSTNQYILDNLKYVKSGDVFVTEHQTQGRGRRGNFWISSAEGGNICLSMYWKTYRTLSSIVQLSLMVSYVIAEILRDLGVSQIKVKWPNDLYVCNSKLSGILIEIITKNSKILHTIIGIGLNVSFSDSEILKFKNKRKWIDLKSMGIIPDINILVITIVRKLRYKLQQFEINNYQFFSYDQNNMNYLQQKSVLLYINNNTVIGCGTVLEINKLNGALSVIDKYGKTHVYLRNDISVDVVV